MGKWTIGGSLEGMALPETFSAFSSQAGATGATSDAPFGPNDALEFTFSLAQFSVSLAVR